MNIDVEKIFSNGSEIAKFLNGAIADPGKSVDRTGRDALIQFADYVKTLDRTSQRYSAFVDSLLSVIQQARAFNSGEIRKLVNFIEVTLVRSDLVVPLLRDRYRKGKDFDLESRAYIGRYLAQNGAIPSYKEIITDTALKQKFFWIWFDILSNIDPCTAIAECCQYVSDTRDFRNLIMRLPAFLNKFGQKLTRDDLLQIVSVLRGDVREGIARKAIATILGVTLPNEAEKSNAVEIADFIPAVSFAH